MLTKRQTELFALLVSSTLLCVSAVPSELQTPSNPTVVQLRTTTQYQQLQSQRSISIVGDHFLVDGRRLQILSGSLHYFRLPAAYWPDRLRKLKAAGLNSVSTYVEWSYHEQEPRQYKFSGDRDVAQFVRAAAQEGLYVLLRPGPYICAERDLGGFPYWLLHKYPNIRLRSLDNDFMNESKIWMDKLFEQLKPLLYGNGGPIILVQVENEYGSYGNDHKYMEAVRELIDPHVGDKALLYTTDGAGWSYFSNGYVNGSLTTIDFGAGANVKARFAELRRFMSTGPLMNSEYYPGWLTHWGEQFQRVDKTPVVKTLEDMLDEEINVNFYMFFGGTNFEFTSGANYGSFYQPDITSYDYDAPLSEAGDPTPKYFAIRDAIAKYFPEVNSIPLPSVSPKGAYGEVTLTPQLYLLSPDGRSALGRSYGDRQYAALPSFETLGQRSGFVLYETALNAISGDSNGTELLQILKPRDRIHVFLDGKLQGVISRADKVDSLALNRQNASLLSLLVENQGRINFGPLLHDYKGILSPVTLGDQILAGRWTITGFPLESVDVSRSKVESEGPVLFEGTFVLPAGDEVKDTYLEPTGWGKGYIWVNGFNLGRYWPGKGPQVTLYVPGVWLRAAPAQNTLQILELEDAAAAPGRVVRLIDHAILDI